MWFSLDRRKDFECFQHKEMVDVWVDGYVTYLAVIITHCIQNIILYSQIRCNYYLSTIKDLKIICLK
jgi:ABC-type metal ion transport system substrate-binding protein